MTAEDFQQYLHSKMSEFKKLHSLPDNDSPEYKRAIQDVVQLLSDERDKVIESCDVLSKLKLTR